MTIMDRIHEHIERALSPQRLLDDAHLRQNADEAAAELELSRWKVMLMAAMRGALLDGRIDDLWRDLQGYATTERAGKRTMLRPV